MTKLIFTNHALQRMNERKLSQDMAMETFRNPDRKYPAKEPNTLEFHKRFENQNVTVIAKPNDRGEWIVLSSWIDPPNPGTIDFKEKLRYKKYQKAGFWGKLWLNITHQFGF